MIFPKEFYPKRIKDCSIHKSRRKFKNKKNKNTIYLLEERFFWMKEYLKDQKVIIELGCGNGACKDILKNRNIIRTNNLVGDLGEYWCIKKYNEIAGLPKLQDAPKSTKNIDAISVNGERYAIKSTSGSGTGVFASVPTNEEVKPLFEYLVLVMFDKDYILKEIYELNWEQFLKFRRIKPPENKWNISITQNLKSEAKKIF